MSFKLKSWERDIQLSFDPLKEKRRSKKFIRPNGEMLDSGVTKGPSAEEAFKQATEYNLPNINDIAFPDHNNFVAGQINTKLDKWKHILQGCPNEQEISDWVEHGIDINKVMVRFNGTFRGVHYDCDYPPPRQFNNSNNCKGFTQFVSETIQERLRNGSITCLGRVGEVESPRIVAPLTVESSKPRLCLNLMYLNNWIKDIHFTLDTLKDVPRVIDMSSHMTSIDDKSGFDNIFLHKNSQTLVGFQWAGYYFCFKSLVFGFKLSSYFYQMLNLQATSYIRRMFDLPMFLYIDDRLIEQVRTKPLGSKSNQALLANYIVCEILVRLGYCLNIDKCVLVPTQSPVFLGFIVDAVEGCFRITEKKRQKFIQLRESLLAKQSVSVLDLQKLSGRAISFMLAVPAAKLYTREMNLAISQGIMTEASIPMTGRLRDEVMFWRFLDTWQGKLAWKTERHLTISIFTDASLYKYGGVICIDSKMVQVSDFWDGSMRKLPIMVLEGYALLSVLKAFKSHVAGKRIDCQVDSQVLIQTWENEGSRSRDMNDVIKGLFNFALENDCTLKLVYVPSKENLADFPSRELNRADATLSRENWDLVDHYYGGRNGHTIDLMALDSNCMKNRFGNLLTHFTPYQTPLSSGVNMFCQEVRRSENCYVYPPFTLVLAVIKFIIENNLTCSIVIPVGCITPSWMPSVGMFVKDAFVLGHAGQKKVIKLPTKKGFVHDKFGLKHNLWVLRIIARSDPCQPVQADLMPYGKFLLLSDPAVGPRCHFLCVGD